VPCSGSGDMVVRTLTHQRRRAWWEASRSRFAATIVSSLATTSATCRPGIAQETRRHRVSCRGRDAHLPLEQRRSRVRSTMMFVFGGLWLLVVLTWSALPLIALV